MTLPPEDSAFLSAIGQRLRTLRAQRGMTRRILARQSGVSERYISAVEGGTGNASILLMRDIAHALNVSLMALLDDTPALAPVAKSPGARARIALIGLRGAGKSTLGAALAAQQGVPFVELDREIERDAGLSLGEIMELHGQAGFRRLERAVLQRLLVEHPAAVFEAGGGIVAEGPTYRLLLAHCFTVWLRAAPEAHMQRVIDQGDLRPMRDNRQAMADLRAILASREALYARADATLDTTGKTVEQSLTALADVACSPA
jgi:XRE family aerobic/anaerobic benzoate catabolism transcriptional regulator